MTDVRITFVEPPKDFWFPMGEYIPPPFVILCLAAYVKREAEGFRIEGIDAQAEDPEGNRFAIWEKMK
jgi:hypothetical protein